MDDTLRYGKGRRGLRKKDRSWPPNDEVSSLPSLIFIFYLLPRSFFFVVVPPLRNKYMSQEVTGMICDRDWRSGNFLRSDEFSFTTRTEYFLTRVEKGVIIRRYDDIRACLFFF